MKSLNKKLLRLRRKDKWKKFFQKKELRSLRFFSKKKPHKNLKLKKWNKNFWLPKQFKKQKPQLQKKQQQKLTLLDLRESTNFQEERQKPNYKC
jgi:hypothetical protein